MADIQNHYFVVEPDYNNCVVLKTSPDSIYKQEFEDVMQSIMSKYTPDNAPRWFYLMLNYKDEIRQYYMIADCNKIHNTPREKMQFAIRKIMDIYDSPINPIIPV